MTSVLGRDVTNTMSDSLPSSRPGSTDLLDPDHLELGLHLILPPLDSNSLLDVDTCGPQDVTLLPSLYPATYCFGDLTVVHVLL